MEALAKFLVKIPKLIALGKMEGRMARTNQAKRNGLTSILRALIRGWFKMNLNFACLYQSACSVSLEYFILSWLVGWLVGFTRVVNWFVNTFIGICCIQSYMSPTVSNIFVVNEIHTIQFPCSILNTYSFDLVMIYSFL